MYYFYTCTYIIKLNVCMCCQLQIRELIYTSYLGLNYNLCKFKCLNLYVLDGYALHVISVYLLMYVMDIWWKFYGSKFELLIHPLSEVHLSYCNSNNILKNKFHFPNPTWLKQLFNY